MKVILDIPENTMRILLKQEDIDKEKKYAKVGGKQKYMDFYRHEPTFEEWLLSSLLERCE